MVARHHLYVGFRTTGCASDLIEPSRSGRILFTLSSVRDIPANNNTAGSLSGKTCHLILDIFNQPFLDIVVDGDSSAFFLAEVDVREVNEGDRHGAALVLDRF